MPSSLLCVPVRFLFKVNICEKQIRVASIVFVDPVVRLAQFLLDHITSRVDLHGTTITLIATCLGHHPDEVHRIADQGLGLGQVFGVIRGRREGFPLVVIPLIGKEVRNVDALIFPDLQCGRRLEQWVIRRAEYAPYPTD